MSAAVPLLTFELLFLVQFYRINSQKAEDRIYNSLTWISQEFTDLTDNMKMVSYMMEKDEVVQRNLQNYLSNVRSKKANTLLEYLQYQIANYEVANPAVSNLTCLYIPKGKEEPIKINPTSLANGKMPIEEQFLCSLESMDFYGPHETSSVAADYSCISMLRPYKLPDRFGKLYIYVESGYKYLRRLETRAMEEVDGNILIESANGRLMYASGPEIRSFVGKKYDAVLEKEGKRCRLYEQNMKGNWKIHIWIPKTHFYSLVYGMALNMMLVTLFLFAVCIWFSNRQWHKVYRIFDDFSVRLKQIADGSGVEGEMERMNIREFDENFVVLDKMRENILLLLNRVQEEEKQRHELEVREVLGKINPHFLYNTLDTLKWCAAEKGDRDMMHSITELNRMLLYNMSFQKKTTLKEELEAIRSYIVLQQLRYDMDVSIETGKHPEILQTEMPRFILQPIVENAIKHGGSDKPMIRIGVELLANGRLSILVKNSGNPIDPEKIRQVLEQKQDVSSNGIGLQYVARMLESFYDKNFVLRAERTKDGFNVVEIRIPFKVGEIFCNEDGKGDI